MGAPTVKVVTTWELGPWKFASRSIQRQWRCGSESVPAVEVILMANGSWEYTVFCVDRTVQDEGDCYWCPADAIKRAGESVGHYLKACGPVSDAIKVAAAWELGPWKFGPCTFVRWWTCGTESVIATTVEIGDDGSWECRVFGVDGSAKDDDALFPDPADAIRRADELIRRYVERWSA